MSTYTFISYSRDDKDIVDRIIYELQGRQVAIWHDRAIEGGGDWKKSIFNAVMGCDSMVVLLSKSYVNSVMCRMEIFLAQCYNKKVIPVMIKEECWTDLHAYRELASLRDYSVINLVTNSIFGLKVAESEQFDKLAASIKNETNSRFADCELFVSYRAQDTSYAVRIAEDLFRDGINTWIAALAYTPGENWQASQWEALMKVKGLVVILSKEVAQSEYIRKEILIAKTRNIPIYPVLVDGPLVASPDYTREINSALDDTKSFEMREINDINWFYPNNPDYYTMLDTLIEVFKRRLT